MSRRKRRTAARKSNRASPERGRPAAADHPAPMPNPPRPYNRFLAVAVLLQAAWIVFLAILAWTG